MDVSVRLSFSGGHVWEFVCEDDNPMVMGVVSALPGAGVDANLPADGLIQVENRAGERLFFPRTSLVGVAIRALPGSVAASPLSTGAPFVLFPDAIASDAVTQILGERGALMPGGQDEFDPLELPDAVTAVLMSAAAQSAAAFAITTGEPTHIDLRLLRAAADRAIMLPERPNALLDLVAVVAASAPLPVTVATGSSAGRKLSLAAGDLLLAPRPGDGPTTILPAAPASGPVMLIAGSLCPGQHSAAP